MWLGTMLGRKRASYLDRANKVGWFDGQNGAVDFGKQALRRVADHDAPNASPADGAHDN